MEDDAASRTAMRFLLGRAGWDVAAVGTIAEAMQSIARTAPDALVLDLMLPDGNGWDVLRALRKKRQPIRVAVVTGASDQVWLGQASELKPDCIFHKPVDINLLLKCLQGKKE